MANLILVVIGLWVLILYPGVIVFAAAVLVILHLLPKYTKQFSAREEEKEPEKSTISPRLKKLYGDAIDEDGIIDWDEYHKDNLKGTFKEGHEDDPEANAIKDRLKEYMAEKKKESDKELQDDINDALNDKERDFWTKRSK